MNVGWKMVRFGDVVKNATLVERDPVKAGIERVVGLEHIDPETLHIKRWDSPEEGTSFTRKFVTGQTLFGKRRAYQRKVAFAEFEGICSGDILTFETKNPKILLPELLPFICQTDMFFNHALGTSAGSLSPRTSWSALQDFEFPLPPLSEQKRIAEILWAADEAVERWDNSYKEFNSLIEIVIRNLMDGDKCNWKSLRFDQVATLQRGFDLPQQFRLTGVYPVIASTGQVASHVNYKIQGPGVVTGRSGTIGKVQYIEGDYWPLNTTLFVNDFHGNDPKFIYLFLEQFRVERFKAGTGVPTLNRNDLHKEYVKIPDMKEQEKIVRIYNILIQYKNNFKNYCLSLKKLAIELLNYLINNKSQEKWYQPNV